MSFWRFIRRILFYDMLFGAVAKPRNEKADSYDNSMERKYYAGYDAGMDDSEYYAPDINEDDRDEYCDGYDDY